MEKSVSLTIWPPYSGVNNPDINLLGVSVGHGGNLDAVVKRKIAASGGNLIPIPQSSSP
jgi:hypothetical protein